MLGSKKNICKLILLTFIMTILMLIPEIISGRGYFVYAGDYSYQQLPFYYHVAENIRNGITSWDWITNYGSDFIGSYSYYSLGSIFLWLVCWIPEGKLIIFLMPFILALKVSTAAVTSFICFKRHVRNEESAFIGAVLYSFSGAQLVNLVFFTFADVIAFFPLLLLSFELLVTERKKVFFAVMVAVMAFTNYYMFFGQTVFIAVYYVYMIINKQYVFKVKSFLTILLEAVLGVMIASVMLIPSYFSVFSVGRATAFLSGVDLLSYNDNAIVPKILQGLFMMPDPPGTATLFNAKNIINDWGSASLYIPVFAFAGVTEYISRNRKNYISGVIILSLIMALIPVCNSAFSLFNSTYYARWFYMPVFFMVLATVKCLDEGYTFKYGLRFQLTGLILLSVVFFFPGKKDSGFDIFTESENDMTSGGEPVKFAGMSSVPDIFWQMMVFAFVFLAIILYYNKFKDTEKFFRKFLALVSALILLTSAVYINNSKRVMFQENYKYRETLLDYTPVLEGDEFFRINDLNDSLMNNNFIWNYPTISSFHSISIAADENFYTKAATEKKLRKNCFTDKDFPVYGLFSVKYLFNHSTGDDLNVENVKVSLKGFELYDKQSYFYIYENQHFVPMGFMYDYSITDERLRNYIAGLDIKEDKEKTHYLQLALMRALIISEEDQEKYSDVIDPLPDSMLENLSADTYFSDCDERAAMSCSTFDYDTHGFRAEFHAEKSGLVFFSVPVFRGWSAKVNGRDAEIITSQYGFSAVKVDKGDNVIEFSYETYGLKAGIFLSLSGILILFIYSAFYYVNLRKSKK